MRTHALVLVCMSLTALSPALAAEQVCVPDPDGEGWRCGTPEEIAQVRPGRVERSASATTSNPPAYLLDPSRAPQISFQGNPTAQRPAATPAPLYRGPAQQQPSRGVPPTLARTPAVPRATPVVQQRAAVAPVRTTPTTPAASPQPAAIVRAAPAAARPVVSQPAIPASGEQAEIDRNIAKLEALTADAPAAATAPVRPAPAPTAPTAVAAAPRSAPATTRAPSPAPPNVATSAPPAKPAATVAAAAPRATAPLAASNLQPNSERFIGWGKREYTIQLVAASSPADFASFAQQAGLDLSTLHQVRLQQPEQTWWLLCYGRYDSLDSAKLAIAQLPNNARSSGAWPRRIGPLQAEQSR